VLEYLHEIIVFIYLFGRLFEIDEKRQQLFNHNGQYPEMNILITNGKRRENNDFNNGAS